MTNIPASEYRPGRQAAYFMGSLALLMALAFMTGKVPYLGLHVLAASATIAFFPLYLLIGWDMVEPRNTLASMLSVVALGVFFVGGGLALGLIL